jgi:hypothetical protein
MKNLLTLEKFTKQYQQKIDVKDFKKIKKGAKILYMGGQVEVLKNDGYVLTLKGKDGKKFTVNKSMFDHGGMVKEVYDGKKKKKKKPFHPDVMYESKGRKVVSDLYKMDGQVDYLSDADDDTKKIWKKAGVNPEDDDMIILYSYVNNWIPTKKLLDKARIKYKELEDPNSAGESFIVFNVNEARAKKVTKQMWKRMSDDKRFDALLSVVKDPDDAEEYVEYRWEELPSGFEYQMVLFELSSAQDGTKDSDGKSKHEDHIEEDIESAWKKTYGEDFVKHYPAVVKIIRQRKIKDKREIARIWQDTYGEDFEKEYPALYNKLP